MVLNHVSVYTTSCIKNVWLYLNVTVYRYITILELTNINYYTELVLCVFENINIEKKKRKKCITIGNS